MSQRFNVTLSRARDRMFLFRSVGETEFKEDSLKAKSSVTSNSCADKMPRMCQALRDRCESGFEFEIFDELVKRRFRVASSSSLSSGTGNDVQGSAGSRVSAAGEVVAVV